MKEDTTFSLGLPDGESDLLTAYGVAKFVSHHEDGTVDLLVNGKIRTVPGATQWRRI